MVQKTERVIEMRTKKKEESFAPLLLRAGHIDHRAEVGIPVADRVEQAESGQHGQRQGQIGRAHV